MRRLVPFASLALFVCASLAVPVPTFAQTGLVAAYGFNEGGGTTTADATGNGNTGTLAGTSWKTAGKFGGALTFDGATSWVTVNHSTSLSLSTGMTLEAWVQTSAPSNWRSVIMKERAGGLAYALYAGDLDGHAASFIRRPGDGNDTDATDSAALSTGAWVHVAATYDGATLKTFVNGAQVAATAIAGTMQTSTLPLRIGGNSIWGEYFSGAIDEVRIYNRALTAAEIQTDMITPVGGVTPVTFGISGSITPSSSGGGATVSLTGGASVSTTADVNGNFSFTGLNNNTYVVTPTKPGLTFTPSSRTVVIGEGGSVSGVNFTAAATGTSPSVVGQWGSPFDVGMVAVNMVMLRTGKVLMTSGSFQATYTERIWDPATGAITLVPNTNYNLFCAGQAQLADGRILFVGGHDPSTMGAPNANIFDPVAQSWSVIPNMAVRRWYPTATTLSDGRILVTSGAQTCPTCFADVPEIYDPVTNAWTRLTTARLGIDYYPFMFLLPDGRVLSAGSSEAAYETRTLDLTTGTWSMVDPVVRDGHSAVMYRPGKVLKTGTAADSGTVGTAAATAFVLDMSQASPAWRQVASMNFPRAFQNSTVLPDGNVLVTGGGSTLDGHDITKGSKTAELWSPASENWTALSSDAIARLYHSTALLLPDGRVLIAGSGDDSGAVNETRAELFSPPYLFKGARPVITSAPDLINYKAIFNVQTPDAASIASVALIRPGSVTHGFDEDQRYVPLAFSVVQGGLAIQAPPDANTAPPGYYMLFIVNTAGVPSIAPFVHFPTPSTDTTKPSAPTNLVGVDGADIVSLNWTPSTDDTGVSSYNIHRATVSGLAPNAANKVGTSTVPSFTDTGVAAGTYFYVVTAQDAAGNTSGQSNEAVVTVLRDITAPTIELTAPADLSKVSGTIVVSATAADDIGVVGVRFWLDGRALGIEDQAAPYAAAWDTTTAPDGDHTIIAIARDATGNQAYASVTVTVANTVPEPAPPAATDTTPPVVAITAPAAQSTVAGSVVITSAATDDVGVAGVQFLLDGAALGGEVTSAPYSITWDTLTAIAGPHTLSAVARDAAGNTTTTAIAVNVSNPAGPPVLDVSVSADQAGTAVTSPIFSTAAGNELILALVATDFLSGPNTIVTGVSGGGLEWTLVGRTNVQAGTAEIWRAFAPAPLTGVQVTATLSQNVWSSIHVVSFSNVDTTGVNGAGAIGATASANSTAGAPSATLVTTRANSWVVGVGTDFDNAAARTLGPNQTMMHQFLSPSGDTYWMQRTSTPAAASGTSVTINDTSPSGDRYNLFICEVRGAAPPDTIAPSISLTSPAGGSTVTGAVTIAATAADDVGVAGVQFRIDGALFGAEMADAPYSAAWDTTTAANGQHMLTAVVRDAAGNTSQSSVTVTVFNDATPPSVSITSPAGQAAVSGAVTITATAADNVGVVGVQFQVDGAALGSEDLAAPYTMNWNTTGVANGSHTLTAVARDAAGNLSQSLVTVTVFNDTTPPSVSITSPASQAAVSGSVTITATATDNVGVVGVQFQVDGVALGGEDLTAPYAATWNAAAAANGTHTLTAIARDAGGRQSQASVVVTVSNPPAGLVAAFNFDEGSGSTAFDASGHGNDGAIRRATYTAGHSGSALSFDGSTAWVTIDDNSSLDLRTGMTLEAWVRPGSTLSVRPVIAKERTTISGVAYALYSANGNSRPAGYVRTDTDHTATSSSALPVSSWSHLAVSYNGSTVRVYVNGTLMASASAPSPIITTSGVLHIGGSTQLSDFFRGLIDDVRIYNRALTATEIQADMMTPVK